MRPGRPVHRGSSGWPVAYYWIDRRRDPEGLLNRIRVGRSAIRHITHIARAEALPTMYQGGPMAPRANRYTR
jgi:hypothetical protein